MPTFIYEAVKNDDSQQIITERITVDSKELLRNMLRASNYTLLTAVEEDVTRKSIHLRKQKIPLKDMVWIMRKLASAQNVGIPLQRAVDDLAVEKAGTFTGSVLSQIGDNLTRGEGVGESFKQTNEFENLVVSIIEAGEKSGKLKEAFTNIASNLTKRLRLRGTVRSALTYPTISVIIVVVGISAMTFIIIPQFKLIFKQFGSQLPLLTRLLVGVVDIVQQWWFLLPLLGVIIYLSLRQMWRTPKYRTYIENFLVTMPLVGNLLRENAYARIVGVVASMLSSGVYLNNALEIAAKVSPYLIYGDALTEISQSINASGLSFSEAIAANNVFSAELRSVVKTGETSGNLTAVLRTYEEDLIDSVDTAAKSLSSVIEPLLIVVIGVVLGTGIIALWLPLIDIIKVIH